MLDVIAPPYTSDFVQLFLPILENDSIAGTIRTEGEHDPVAEFIGKWNTNILSLWKYSVLIKSLLPCATNKSFASTQKWTVKLKITCLKVMRFKVISLFSAHCKSNFIMINWCGLIVPGRPHRDRRSVISMTTKRSAWHLKHTARGRTVQFDQENDLFLLRQQMSTSWWKSNKTEASEDAAKCFLFSCIFDFLYFVGSSCFKIKSWICTSLYFFVFYEIIKCNFCCFNH